MKPKLNTPRKRSGQKFYHNGLYTVKNQLKYIGDPTKVMYRSMWELKFFQYADSNDAILRWSSEFIVIPYQQQDGSFHRYYPDIYIEKVNPNDPNILDRFVIEIKPYVEIFPDFIAENGTIMPPEQYLKKLTPTALESYEYRLTTYQKNLYKWTKARHWCTANGYQFLMLHEKYLKQMRIL